MGRWWPQALLLLVVIFFLLGVPPVSTAVQWLLEEYWVVSSVLSLQRTLNGAHTSILVTEGCKLRLFDAILVATATAEVAEDSWLGLVVGRFSSWMTGTPCGSLRSIGDAAALLHGSATVDLRRLRLLLLALESLGLVKSCTIDAAMSKESPAHSDRSLVLGFRNARHTQRFLTTRRRLSAMADGRIVEGAENTDYLCGMGIIANDDNVLLRLTKLSTVILRQSGVGAPSDDPEKRTFLAPNVLVDESKDSDDNDMYDAALWTSFAANSGAFSHSIAERVASTFKDILCEQDEGLTLVDIGCGSGEFLRAAVVEAGRCSHNRALLAAVYTDLPGPLEQTAIQHNSWMARSSLPVEAVDFSYVAGSIFEKETQRRIALKLVAGTPRRSHAVMMMNSFLQHIAPSEAALLIKSLETELLQESSTRGVKLDVTLVITELVVPSDEHFTLWTELTPMARVFSAVLSSFTRKGEVRSAEAYHAIGAAAGCRFARSESLFPMPATFFVFRCLM
jgi:hypothetical protein